MPYAVVVGTPIGHSLSPVLHRAAYAGLGLSDWSYQPIECTEAGFPALLAGLDLDCAGLSVTMPLKRVALAEATARSALAEAVGAANTLVRRDGGWYADNTDVAGIAGALGEAGVRSAAGAVLLGAGGTAQAALAALRELGEPAPTVLVREPRRAGALRETALRLGVHPTVVRGIDDAEVGDAPVVISALPRGAADRLGRSTRWTSDGVLLDVIYDPWPTVLADSAMRAGRTVISGSSMLLHQAVRQVQLMTGHPAPTAAMRAALAEVTGRG
jgi:shikimate dehydrogenase